MEVSESYVAMFKGMISLAWADGELEDGEKQLLLHYIEKNTALTDAWKKELRDKVDHPVSIHDVWKDITDPQHRAHVINVSSHIFHSDGERESIEDELHRFIEEEHLSSLDVQGMKEELETLAVKLHEKRELEMKIHDDKIGPIGRLLEYIDNFF